MTKLNNKCNKSELCLDTFFSLGLVHITFYLTFSVYVRKAHSVHDKCVKKVQKFWPPSGWYMLVYGKKDDGIAQ